jgi:hypothetical protein
MVLIRFAFLLAAALAATAGQAQVAFRASATGFSAAGGGITHVAAGTLSTRDTCGAVTPGLPAGRAAGDLMVALVNQRESSAVNTAPAGWTQIHTAIPATDFQVFVYYRIATNTAADNFSFTQATTCSSLGARISAFRNVDPNNPFEFAGSIPGASVASATAGDLDAGTETTLSVAAMTLVLGFIIDDRTVTAGAGWSESFDNAQNVARDYGISLHYQLRTAAGATGGALNWDLSGGGTVVRSGIVVNLRPRAELRIPLPAGTAAGDVMIATVAVRTSASAITAPAGWTLVRETVQAADATMRMATYRRNADGTEPAAYAWTFSGTHSGATGGIISFTGADTVSASPIDVEGGNTTASAFDHAATAVTTTRPNAMLVSSHAFLSSAGWTPPAGMSEAVDVASLATPDAAGIAQSMNYVLQPAVGSTGDKTASASNTAPADAGNGVAHLLALKAAYTHYAVSYPGGSNFANCEPALVRITAHHPGHLEAAPPAGTVLTINTSTADGVWESPLVTGTPGNWAPSGANNGVATYTWNGTETFIEAHLRRNTPTVAPHLSLNLTDTNARSEGAGEDLAVTFASSVLRITANGSSSTNINTQIAGKRNTEGANVQALYVQAVATSPGTGNCQARFRNQTRDIEFAAVCNNPATCFDPDVNDAPLFEVFSGDGTGAAVNIQKNNNTVTPASYATVSLNFSNDANAMAPLVFRYGDAGQMTLHLRHVLPGASGTITGASNAFVVRPFGMAVRGASAGAPIAHSSTDAGTVLAAAGDNFTMTIAAYKWASAAQDANNDGIPDFALADVVDITGNGLTPNFAPASTSVNAGSNIPGIAAGAITRGVNCASAGTIAAGSWSGGAATVTDWCYSEAGNVQVAALAVDYISAGVNVIGLSSFDGTGFTGGHVGRFRPKHFAVSGAALGNRADSACAPASSFSYLGEPLTLTFTLTAQNRQNATTQNYTGTYAKLGLTTFANWALGARSGATNLTTRLDTGTAPTGSWSNGVASGVVLTTAVRRASPDNPDGPYAATAFGIAPADADGVAMNTLDLDVDNNAAMDRKNLGVAGELRYGRLRLFNASGPEKVQLPIRFRAEHWNGTTFALNTDDDCTTVARNTIAMSFTPPSNLAACETAFTAASATVTDGLATLYLAAPGAGNTGSVLLTPQLYSPAAGTFCATVGGATAAAQNANRPYLTGRWNDAANPDSDASTSYDDNPSGRASFGVYGSQPNNYIYFRENY